MAGRSAARPPGRSRTTYHILYKDAVDRYGIDRPDMRFEMLLHDVSGLVAGGGFKVFAETVAGGGIVKGLRRRWGEVHPQGDRRVRIDAKDYGAKGLAWCKLENGALTGGVSKFLSRNSSRPPRRAMC